MESKKTDEQLWAEALSVFEDNKSAIASSSQDATKFLSPHARKPLWLSRIAAVVVVALLVGGLAWGAVRLARMERTSQPRPVSLDTVIVGKTAISADSVRLFSGERLDSVLQIVGQHYSRSVCFQDDSLGSIRVLARWHVSQPLETFVSMLNDFEGFSVSDERDTLFVTIREGEDGQ